MFVGRKSVAVLALLAGWPAAAQEAPATTACGRILARIEEPDLRQIVDEAVSRNPGVRAAEARAQAAAQKAPQMRALPDPVASATAFLATPETRTGPQRLAVGILQALPGFGKLARRGRAAVLAATALGAEVEAQRLKVATEARRLYLEIAFLDRHRAINEDFRAHLLQHEEIARVRYSTGVGPGQGVLKLQAEITRVDKTLLDIEARRVAQVARLNALRDRQAATAVTPTGALPPREVVLDPEGLVERSRAWRPELAAADARIARAETLIEVAERDYRPDFRVGLTYTLIDPREDAPGRLQPPPGNGDDVFGIQGGITLPVWRARLEAGLEEAIAARAAAEQDRRDVEVSIESSIGELTGRLPLAWRQLRLVEDLLIVQAQESLESAQAGYVAGTLNALDLLDAEHILFDAQTARARAETDYRIGLARLEGALGGPLPTSTATEQSES